MHNTIVMILVNTGSSHTFISHVLVQKLKLNIESTGHLLATLADGRSIESTAVCRKVQWLIQNYDFSFDMRVMSLRGWDIILGVDWMY